MHMLADSIDKILDKDTFIPIFVLGSGMFVMIVWIVFSSIRSIVVGRAREVTRREIAAYVAEGSLDPDKAVAILNAGKTTDDDSKKCCM
ncbi:MAG TPA: hypothetical protein VG711_03590 [Phycisphaerales bacterium]|nr:hypothetical protein [Phycisphaerales bacterium]